MVISIQSLVSALLAMEMESGPNSARSRGGRAQEHRAHCRCSPCLHLHAPRIAIPLSSRRTRSRGAAPPHRPRGPKSKPPQNSIRNIPIPSTKFTKPQHSRQSPARLGPKSATTLPLPSRSVRKPSSPRRRRRDGLLGALILAGF